MSWEPKPVYHLAEKTIPKEHLDELITWLQSDPWLTQGELVREFEAAFAKKVGFKHAVFVNSGSSANLLAWYLPIVLDREQVLENPRVVVPAVSWATSVMPAIQFGYAPVLCEADEATWGLDPADLRRICEKAPPAIVLNVHTLGVPSRMKEIDALRREFGFLLIEDSCAAFGSAPIGKVGEIATFSTYYGHQFSTIEGGFVCINGSSEDASNRGDNYLRMLRSHGWAADCDPAWRAAISKEVGVAGSFREKFTFYVPGFNVRGDDLRAKIGLLQLSAVDGWTAARRTHHELYREKFAGAAAFKIQSAPAGSDVASIGFGVLASSKAHRDKVVAALVGKGIETRPIGGGNMARQPFWSGLFGEQKRERPIADRIHDCGFQLPNHADLTAEDVDHIARTALAAAP